MKHWVLDYRREWLRADLTAGLTAAAVVIPKAMAIAVIAGLAVEVGLYTALAAMLVYPLLGTSRAWCWSWNAAPFRISNTPPLRSARRDATQKRSGTRLALAA